MDAKQLNDVQELFDACDAATNKTQRKAVSLTKAFRQELGEMQKVIIGSYSAAVMALMRDHVVAALHFCGQALSLDGFTTALSTEPSERPQVRVPVSIDSFEQMESELLAKDWLSHKVLKTLKVPGQASYPQHSQDLADVMRRALSTTTGMGATLSEQGVSMIEDSAMMAMLPWMSELGVVQETIDSLWQGTLVAAYNRAARGDIEKAITTLRARLGQCMKGDLVCIDEKTSASLLGRLPASTLKQFLVDWFGCTKSYFQLPGASDVSVDDPEVAQAIAASLVDQVPKLLSTWAEIQTASGQAEECSACQLFCASDEDFSSSQMQQFLEQMKSKAQAELDDTLKRNQDTIHKVFATASKLLANIPKDDVEVFKQFMKAKGGAKVQQHDTQLKNLRHNHGLGPGDVVLAKARAIEGQLLQVTCVYVAMTLGAHPEIASKCSEGAKQREILKTVVEQLEGLPASVKEEIDPLFLTGGLS